MAKVKKAANTVIIVPNDTAEFCGVSTSNAKWIRRMEKLEAEGHAEEVESSVEGAREWELDRSLIRLPFFRKPREWTEEQKEEARERLAKVRAEVKAKREAEAEEEDEAPAPKPKKKVKKKAAPAPVEDEDEDDEIEDEEIDDEDEEEVVVKKKSTRKRPRK